MVTRRRSRNPGGCNELGADRLPIWHGGKVRVCSGPMSADTEKREAQRLLNGLENGGMSADDAGMIAERVDPVLVYSIVRYLRENYPASDPAATPVLERVVDLTTGNRKFIAQVKAGEEDSVSVWFADEYSFRDFRGKGAELIELIVDKLES